MDSEMQPTFLEQDFRQVVIPSLEEIQARLLIPLQPRPSSDQHPRMTPEEAERERRKTFIRNFLHGKHKKKEDGNEQVLVVPKPEEILGSHRYGCDEFGAILGSERWRKRMGQENKGNEGKGLLKRLMGRQ
ncbi:hypothetical protein C8Q75DRAFT_737825 [Abortiporus biennis]|nr:hypothetical protein C8Q75DRAFT_737825 [Abortiporus biennis]